jgi:hypothetical protein
VCGCREADFHGPSCLSRLNTRQRRRTGIGCSGKETQQSYTEDESYAPQMAAPFFFSKYRERVMQVDHHRNLRSDSVPAAEKFGENLNRLHSLLADRAAFDIM